MKKSLELTHVASLSCGYSLHKDPNGLFYFLDKNAELVGIPGEPSPAFEEYKTYEKYIFLKPFRKGDFYPFLFEEDKWLYKDLQKGSSLVDLAFISGDPGDYFLQVHGYLGNQIYLISERKWLAEPHCPEQPANILKISCRRFFEKPALILESYDQYNPFSVYFINEKKYLEVQQHKEASTPYHTRVFKKINENAAIINMRPAGRNEAVYLFKEKKYLNYNEAEKFEYCLLSSTEGIAVKLKDNDWCIFDYKTLEPVYGMISFKKYNFSSIDQNKDGKFIVKSRLASFEKDEYSHPVSLK
jgi:hypothetical protein